MSAVYLHNALYTPEVVESRSNFPHSRNVSTVSSATLHTSTTLHSHPTEPLLPPATQDLQSYYEVLSRSSRLIEASPARPQWEQRIQLEGNAVGQPEKTGYWEGTRQKRLRHLQWSKIALEGIAASLTYSQCVADGIIAIVFTGVWAIYNTVRYFLAFTIYQSVVGQTVSLAAGVCTGLSFAFLACATILTLLQPILVAHGIPYKSILSVRLALQYLAAVLLFSPAAINFAMVFPWRNSRDLQLNLKYRCYADIDTIWSITYRMCNGKSPAWGVWITLSTLRLLFTAAILIAYHFVISVDKRRGPPLTHRSRRKHHHNRSDSFSYQSPNPQQQMAGLPFPASHLTEDQRQLSDSTLAARTKSSQRRPRLSHSRSSGLSSSDAMAAAAGDGQLSSYFQYQNIPLPIVHENNERDLDGFVDRFRSLVSQIHQETEDALEFARSEETTSRHTIESPPPHGFISPDPPSSDDDLDDDDHGQPDQDHHHLHLHDNTNDLDDDLDDDDEGGFYAPSRPPSLGYNEFGQPYPADQQIRMLNGFIRRMPTIESMGSREMGSSIAASSLYARDHDFDSNKRGSVQTNRSNSRPPTRNTLTWTDYSGSEPSSRTNSLSVQVERLAALGLLTTANANNGGAVGGHVASELGELLGAGRLSVRRVGAFGSPTNVSFGNDSGGEAVNGGEGYSSSTSGSRSTNVSYHTATTGSAKTGSAVAVEEGEQTGGSSGFSSSTTTASIPPPPPPKGS